MRPTLLEFRSIKERTPSSYDPKGAYDGRFIFFQAPKGDNRRCSFSQEKRFISYNTLAKRTGYRVGPGSYSPESYREHIKCGSPYKEYHCKKNTDNNGYYMVGNCLEFEPLMLLNSKKKLQKEKNIKLDSTYIFNRLSKSAATTNNSVNIEPHKAFESLKEETEGTAEKISHMSPKTGKRISKRIRHLNNSLKIDHLLKKRFHQL